MKLGKKCGQKTLIQVVTKMFFRKKKIQFKDLKDMRKWLDKKVKSEKEMACYVFSHHPHLLSLVNGQVIAYEKMLKRVNESIKRYGEGK